MLRFPLSRTALAGLTAIASVGQVHAFSFENEFLSGNFDSTLTAGFGRRTENQSASLIQAGNTGGPQGQATPLAAVGDQGDLNYAKGDYFTQYLKGSHELLLKLPQKVSFMARANWLRDWGATRTTGYESVTTVNNFVPNEGDYANGLAAGARKDLRFKGRMLDLWVSKTFDIGGQQTRVRAGQQVINWGESLFAPGGINATNPVDIMRLSQPGTQIKEGLLPTPAISVASGLGHGLNVEAYVQTRWERSYMPPTGSYWSVVNGLGRGREAYGVQEQDARKTGQWGVALKYRPAGTSLDLGLYGLNYHDKAPQLRFAGGVVPIPGDPATALPLTLAYPEDRKLIGVSANFPVGEVAVGTELSYRPKEAVALNPNVDFCSGNAGRCWVDEKKLQWHTTAFSLLTPSNAGPLLNLLGADGGAFLGEFVVMHFPSLKQAYFGSPISAGGWGWGNETDPTAAPVSAGSKTSTGLHMDFSWTYDGTVLPGWQVTPEIFYQRAISGRTPTLSGNYMKGAQNANLIVTFTRNPATWAFGLNYAKFWGGEQLLANVLRDRDFVGAYAQFNF